METEVKQPTNESHAVLTWAVELRGGARSDYMAELFGTRDIDTDQWHTDGCETCDFGSNYEVEFLIGGEEC